MTSFLLPSTEPLPTADEEGEGMSLKKKGKNKGRRYPSKKGKKKERRGGDGVQPSRTIKEKQWIKKRNIDTHLLLLLDEKFDGILNKGMNKLEVW